MEITQTFFENIRIWSKRKHRLLQNYLPPFIGKVASATLSRNVFCIDAFAGAAKYDDGSDGSPLLMAKFSNVCRSWSKPVNLNVITVEPDVGNFESLVEVLASEDLVNAVTSYNDQFENSVATIIDVIGDAPTLFFIDPFGPKDLPMEQLVPVLRRKPAITELIFNFHAAGLYRIACAAKSDKIDPKAAQANASIVNRVLGSDKWLEELDLNTVNAETGEAFLLDQYIKSLEGYGFFVSSYAIREAIDAKPKYYFVHCSRHRDGVLLMNDFVRAEDDRIFGEYVENEMPLFQCESTLAVEIENRRQRLNQVILDFLAEHPITNRKSIRTHLVFENFGVFHSKDYTEVVYRLLENGVLGKKKASKRINDMDMLELIQK